MSHHGVLRTEYKYCIYSRYCGEYPPPYLRYLLYPVIHTESVTCLGSLYKYKYKYNN
jgi:hypothetical protein